MILQPQQFLASKALDERQWLRAREGRITATLIAKASTRSGFDEAADSLITPPPPIDDNAYMAFGREMEPEIALWLKDQHGIMPNDWLVSHADHADHVATPDGISYWQPMISEIKTTGKDWGSWKQVPIQYRRQVQWQLYVTGAEQCVFAWMLRAEHQGNMIPAWIEPKSVVVDRDDSYIRELLATAEQLVERRDSATVQP